MEFIITVPFDRKNYRLKVVRTFVDDRTERYEIRARNGTIVVECNWPVFKSRGLKHRRPTWKIVSGDIHYRSLMKVILSKLEEEVIKNETSQKR